MKNNSRSIDINKSPFTNPLWTASGLLILSCCLGLLNLYFGTGQYTLYMFSFYLTQPKVILFNCLPFIFLAFLLWFITNRAWIAFLIDGLVCLFYSWASYWKLMARSDPIYAEDLSVFKAAAQMSTQYIHVTWQIILSAVLVSMATVLLAFLFKSKIKRPVLRIIPIALIVAASAGLYTGVYTNETIYNSFQTWSSLNKWFENTQYMSRGSIYPFIYSISDAMKTAPDGYNSMEARTILESYDNDDIPQDEKVSVICFMLEAFSDLTDYTDALDGVDAYEAYHEICSQAYTGNLVTNIFAGGTIDTERTAITGFYSLPSLRSPSWSYARYFSGQGYSLLGAHAGYQEFYNRVNVNENLGFDNYLFIENYFSDETEGIPTDEMFLNHMAYRFLEEISNGSPVFSYNVTYQNHGPYSDTEQYFSKEYISLESAGSQAAYNILNNYLCGIEDTCINLKSITDQFGKSDEPIILVLFGDHKPWLGDQSWVYPEIGINLDDWQGNWFYNMYATEYVIWANDAAKEILGNDFSGKGSDISPCFLMNELFDLCGWEGPSYMKFTDEVKDLTSIITTLDWYKENGKLVQYDDLSDNAKNYIKKMDYLQYYLSREAYR